MSTKLPYKYSHTRGHKVIGTENIYECDSVIIAVSQSPTINIVANNIGIETNKHGLLVTDELGHTRYFCVRRCSYWSENRS